MVAASVRKMEGNGCEDEHSTTIKAERVTLTGNGMWNMKCLCTNYMKLTF
jgi:hypothetical protein